MSDDNQNIPTNDIVDTQDTEEPEVQETVEAPEEPQETPEAPEEPETVEEPEEEEKEPEEIPEPEIRDITKEKELEIDKENYDPYDPNAVAKIAAEVTEPLKEQLFQTRVDAELNQLFAENPEYQKYESRIRKYVSHPNRQKFIKQGLPVKTVALEAIGNDLLAVGAEKAREADTKAKISKSGTQPTSTPKVQDLTSRVANASIEDMDKMINDVKYGLNDKK